METPDVYVLELSSFQLETTASLILDAATVLNVCEDHMDRYASLPIMLLPKHVFWHTQKLQCLNRDDAGALSMRLKMTVTVWLKCCA